MPKRVVIEGRLAWAGQCRWCEGLVVITDKDPNGDFATYHDTPICEEYKKRVQHTEDMGKKERTIEPVSDVRREKE